MTAFNYRLYLEEGLTQALNNFIQQKFPELATQNTHETEPKVYDALVKPTKDVKFGDYQVNGVLPLAKIFKANPRELATGFVDFLQSSPLANDFVKIEVAGPGFINLFLNDARIGELTASVTQVPTVDNPQKIVVDYSAPNIAKEMHVGHLRTTIIGDSVVRVLQYLGHNVVKANHIGDWGTQFGMLIGFMEHVEADGNLNVDVADLDAFYRQAKAHFDANPEFQDYARSLVVKLQAGDEHYLAQWRKLVEVTMSQNNRTYQRLGVLLTDDDIYGESFYNPLLPGVVQQALDTGIAKVDDGAVVVHLEQYKNKDGEDFGVILRKSDGGYLYATTDLAAMKYRGQELKADRILYCTDSRQATHFAQIEIIARQLGYLSPAQEVQHVGFGMMLGTDGKPFKSRSGEVVKLGDLLDESIARTTKLVDERGNELTAQERQDVIEAMAYGAIKYSDLSKNRITDYVFDWDRMISFEGNTAPYMQYSYTRIASILRRLEDNQAENQAETTQTAPVQVTNVYERNLSLKLLEFVDVVQRVGQQCTPHLICQYIFELASVFNAFYENVNVVKTEDPALRASRTSLIKYTAHVLKTGLDLLGIKTVERM